MLSTPIPRLAPGSELDGLNVRSGHDEFAVFASHGQDGHFLQSSSASRYTAAHAGFFILSQSGERPLR